MAQAHEPGAPLSDGRQRTTDDSRVDPLSVAESGWVNPDEVEDESPGLRGRLTRGRTAERRRPPAPPSAPPSGRSGSAGDPLSVLANAIDSGTAPTEVPDDQRRRWFGRRTDENAHAPSSPRANEGESEFDVHNLVGPSRPSERPRPEEAPAAPVPDDVALTPPPAPEPAPDPLSTVWSESAAEEPPVEETAELEPQPDPVEPTLAAEAPPEPAEAEPVPEPEATAPAEPAEQPSLRPVESEEEAAPPDLRPRTRGRFARRSQPERDRGQEPAPDAAQAPQPATVDDAAVAPAEPAEAAAHDTGQAQNQPWNELYEPEEYVAGAGVAAAPAHHAHDAPAGETTVLPTVEDDQAPQETEQAEQPTEDGEHVWTAEELAAEGWTTADLKGAGWTDEDLDSIGWPPAAAQSPEDSEATQNTTEHAPAAQPGETVTAAAGTPEQPPADEPGPREPAPQDPTPHGTTPPEATPQETTVPSRSTASEEPLSFDDEMPEDEPLMFDDEPFDGQRAADPARTDASPATEQQDDAHDAERTGGQEAATPAATADETSADQQPDDEASGEQHERRGTGLLAAAAGAVGAGALAARLGKHDSADSESAAQLDAHSESEAEAQDAQEPPEQPVEHAEEQSAEPPTQQGAPEPPVEHAEEQSADPPTQQAAAEPPVETPPKPAAVAPAESEHRAEKPAAAESPAGADSATATTTRPREDKPAVKIPNFVEYRPTDVRRLALGAGFVVAAVLAVLAIFHAVQSPGAASIILAIAVVVITGALWWALISVAPTVVTIGRGVVEVAHGPAAKSFDLRAPGTEVDLGDPDSDSWRAVLHNAAGETTTLTARQVPPRQFARLVEHWRSQSPTEA